MERLGMAKLANDEHLMPLKNKYMETWQRLKDRSNADQNEHMKDKNMYTDGVETSPEIEAGIIQFVQLFSECDELMLKILEIYFAKFNTENAMMRSLIEHHCILITENFEYSSPTPFPPRIGYTRRATESVYVAYDLKIRYRKNDAVLKMLIDNTYKLDEVLAKLPETKKVMYQRYDDLTQCFKNCDNKIWRIMILGGLQVCNKGFLKDHLDLRDRFRKFSEWIKEAYDFEVISKDYNYFADPDPHTLDGAAKQCVKEFLDIIQLMFQIYYTSKNDDNSCSSNVRFPYLKYTEYMDKLDASIKLLADLEREGNYKKSVCSLRNAIPEPPTGNRLEKLRYKHWGIPRAHFEEFCNKVEKNWLNEE